MKVPICGFLLYSYNKNVCKTDTLTVAKYLQFVLYFSLSPNPEPGYILRSNLSLAEINGMQLM